MYPFYAINYKTNLSTSVDGECDSHSDEEIKQIFSLKKIAVVGMSRHTTKAAHFVPKYLTEQGFDITPVNPNSTEILGKKSYPRCIIH